MALPAFLSKALTLVPSPNGRGMSEGQGEGAINPFQTLELNPKKDVAPQKKSMTVNFNLRGMYSLRCIASALLFSAGVFTSNAQQQSRYGSITGRVYDAATKDSIPLVTVVIVGSTLGGATNEEGWFIINRIPPGTYELQASAIGYASLIHREIIVRASEETQISFSLVEQSVQVGEVVVTGQQIVTPNLPVSTQYLTYKEIQNTAGAFDDVVRTVSSLPGVAQSRADRNDLIVRGGAATENLFLVDNIEVPNIDHFGTQGSGGGSVSFVNLEFVENTSFSAGGFGVRYGDKLSSVLSIGMREGRSDKNRVKAAVSATEVGLNLEGPVLEGGSYLFSARRSYLDPLFKIYGFAFAPYYWDFLGKVSYQMGKSDKLEVLGIGAIDKIKFFNDTQEHKSTNDRQLFSNQNQGVGGATWRHGFDEGYSMITIRHSYADFRYHQKGDSINPYISNISFERETSIRADAEFALTNSTGISAGVEGRIPQLDNTLVTTVIPTGYTTDPKILAIDISTDSSGFKGAAYVQISQSFGEITMTVGVRGDYLSLITHKSVVAPRVSASYAISPVTKITASIGRYYQAPSYIWLMPNPYNHGLDYLKANQYVAGVEHFIRSDFKVSLEGYVKEYSDYPVSITRPYLVMVNTGTELREVAEAYSSFGLDFMQSSGTGLAQGIDLYLEKRLSEIPFYGRLTLSYSEAWFKALDGISRPSNSDQRWKLNAGFGYIIDERWEVTSTFRFYTGRPYTPFGLGTFKRQVSDYNTARVGVNHSLNLRVARRWTFDATIVSAYLDIQNVYNRKPLEPPSWNQAKKVPEQPPTIGIVPSLGVSVEF